MGNRPAALGVVLVAACTFGSNVGGDGDGGDTGPMGSTGMAATGVVTGPGDTGSGTGGAGGSETGTTMPLDDGNDTQRGSTTQTASESGAESTTGSGTESDDGTSTGGGPPAFGEPVRIDELSDAMALDDDPTVRFDDLEIYFNSNRMGGSEIWMSTRTDPDDPWEAPTLATALNSPVGDTTPKLSADGLVIVLSSNRMPSASNDLWVSSRDDLVSPWSVPVRFADVSSVGGDFGGTPIGNAIYVCSERVGGQGLADIWRVPGVDFSGPSAQAAVNEMGLNTMGDDCTLSMSADELEVFWEHRAVGGEWDLWRATRTTVDAQWEGLAPVEELNTAFGDNDPWLLPDGDRLYFASLREGSSDLYVAQR